MKLVYFYDDNLQVVRCAVLEGEERPNATTAAVANDHEDLHLEGAHGVLDGGPGAGVFGLQLKKTKGDRVRSLSMHAPGGGRARKKKRRRSVGVYAYLVVGWDHGGDVADGEGLTGQQAQGHRRAHTGVSAGEHHVLHAAEEENHHQVGSAKRGSTQSKTSPAPMALLSIST